MGNLKELNVQELEQINGGSKRDYNVAYGAGKSIRNGIIWLWDHTLGCEVAYSI